MRPRLALLTVAVGLSLSPPARGDAYDSPACALAQIRTHAAGKLPASEKVCAHLEGEDGGGTCSVVAGLAGGLRGGKTEVYLTTPSDGSPPKYWLMIRDKLEPDGPAIYGARPLPLPDDCRGGHCELVGKPRLHKATFAGMPANALELDVRVSTFTTDAETGEQVASGAYHVYELAICGESSTPDNPGVDCAEAIEGGGGASCTGALADDGELSVTCTRTLHQRL